MSNTQTLMILIILFLSGSIQSKAAEGENPWIAHATSTPSGFTVAITGGGFDPGSVEVVVFLPGPKADQRDSAVEWIRERAKTWAGETPLLPELPLENDRKEHFTQTLKPVHASKHTVFACLPAHPWFPLGYPTVVIWLKDGDKLSQPFLLNRIDAWNLLHPTSHPGDVNRINGFHIRGERYAQNHVFLKVPDGTVRELEKVFRHREDSFSSDYTVSFRIPNDVKPGKGYRLFLHNNSGGAYGFSQFLPLDIVTRPETGLAFVNIAERGIIGDSYTDQREALQKVIDELGEGGGGIIFFPPGSYRIGGILQLRDNTVLRGAGRENSILFYDWDADPKKENPSSWFVSSRGVNRTGLEDLTVRVGNKRKEYALNYYNGDKPAFDNHIRRCRFEGGIVGVHNNVRMEIVDCIFIKSKLHARQLEDSWVHGNEFSMGRLGGNPVSFWGTENCTIEHNRVHTSNRGFVWQNHSEIGHYHNFIGSNMVEGNRMGTNAGETYLFEGSGFYWYGEPSRVSDDGFSVAEPLWEPGKLERYFAVVVSGKGIGQFARIASNSANRITLEKPWRVLPSGDIRISILKGAVQNVIVNNRQVDCDNSMMFYGSGAIDNRVIRNLSENTLGISIWSSGDAKKNVLVPDYFNVFESNIFEDQGQFWLTKRSSIVQPEGLRNVANVFRLNFMADVRRKRENQYGAVWESIKGDYRPLAAAFWMGIGRNNEKAKCSHPIWNDTLIEKNYITRTSRGVEIGYANAGTVVRGNTFFDVHEPVIDRGIKSYLTGNRLEANEESAKKP